MLENGVGEVPDELVVSEMCEVYHCTPAQWRTEFSLWEQQVFWQIQQMKRAKANQDSHNAEVAASGKQVISHA